MSGDLALEETDAGDVSWVIPVIFVTNLAGPCAGKTLSIAITLSLEGGQSGTGYAEVKLVDWS